MNVSYDHSLLMKRCDATFYIVRKGSLTGHFAGAKVETTEPGRKAASRLSPATIRV